MRSFFDTSVLVPAFIEDHEHHEASLAVFLKANKVRDGCSAHSLAEIYATLTRLPGRNRFAGEQVLLVLANIRERLHLVALDGDEYFDAIQSAADLQIAGGTIYDALIARCAIKARADRLYTWNSKHFELFGAAVRKILHRP